MARKYNPNGNYSYNDDISSLKKQIANDAAQGNTDLNSAADLISSLDRIDTSSFAPKGVNIRNGVNVNNDATGRIKSTNIQKYNVGKGNFKTPDFSAIDGMISTQKSQITRRISELNAEKRKREAEEEAARKAAEKAANSSSKGRSSVGYSDGSVGGYVPSLDDHVVNYDSLNKDSETYTLYDDDGNKIGTFDKRKVEEKKEEPEKKGFLDGVKEAVGNFADDVFHSKDEETGLPKRLVELQNKQEEERLEERDKVYGTNLDMITGLDANRWAKTVNDLGLTPKDEDGNPVKLPYIGSTATDYSDNPAVTAISDKYKKQYMEDYDNYGKKEEKPVVDEADVLAGYEEDYGNKSPREIAKGLEDKIDELRVRSYNAQTGGSFGSDELTPEAQQYADSIKATREQEEEKKKIKAQSSTNWMHDRSIEMDDMSDSDREKFMSMFNMYKEMDSLELQMTPDALARINEINDAIPTLRNELEDRGINVTELIQYQDILRNAKMDEENAERAKKYADEHPVAATAARLATAPFGGAGAAIDIAGQNLWRAVTGSDAPVDLHTQAQQGINEATAMVEEIAQNTYDSVLEKTGSPMAAKLASATYQLGISAADSMITGVAGGAAATAMLGSMAAQQSYKDAIAAGATDEQALAFGSIAGIAEGFFERYTIERFLNDIKVGKTSDLGKFIFDMGKNAIGEGSEEGLTQFADDMAEYLILGDNSQISRSYKDAYDAAIKQGLTPEQANKAGANAAAQFFTKDIMGAAIGGAVMGVGMGAAGRGAGRIIGALNERQANRDIQNGRIPVLNEYLTENGETVQQNAPSLETVLNGDDLGAVEAQQYIPNEALDYVQEQDIPSIDNGNINIDNVTERGVENGNEQTGRDGVSGVFGNANEIGKEVGNKPERGRSSVGRSQVLYRTVTDNPVIQKAINETGATNITLRETTNDPQRFSYALSEAIKSNSHGLFVSPKSVEELQQDRTITFMSDDGLAGALVTKDGDIEAVFKNSASNARGAVTPLLLTAIENGGHKLDCYGYNLVKKYNQHGFVPVAVIPFNPEYAPDGWTFGKQDVYVMKLQDGLTAEDVASKLNLSEEEGGFHLWSKEELDALPVFDGENGYDEALAYRDSLIGKDDMRNGQLPSLDDSAIGATHRGSTAGLSKAQSERNANVQSQTNSLDSIRSTMNAEDRAATEEEQTHRRNTFAELEHNAEIERSMEDVTDTVERLTAYDSWGDSDVALAQQTMKDLQEQLDLVDDTDSDAYKMIAHRIKQFGRTYQEHLSKIGQALNAAKLNMDRNHIISAAQKVVDDIAKDRAIADPSKANDVRNAVDTAMDKAQNTADEEIKKSFTQQFRDAVRESGLKMSEIVKESKSNKKMAQRAIAGKLQKLYGINIDESQNMADKFLREWNNTVAKEVERQLNKKLKPKTEVERKAQAELVDAIRMGIYSNSDVQDLINAKYGIEALSEEQQKRIEALADEAEMLPYESKQRVEKEQQIAAVVAQNIGSTFSDKANAWRYMAMLGNIRTNLRNIGGNISMGANVYAKNEVLFMAESLASVFKKNMKRTASSMIAPTKANRELLAACYQDAELNMFRSLTGQSKYFSAEQEARNQRRIFKNGFLETARIKTNDALSEADVKGSLGALKGILPANVYNWVENNVNAFGGKGFVGIAGLQNAYARALASYLKANGKDASALESTTNDSDIDFANEARAHALQEALEATYHEDSKLADGIQKVKAATRGNKAANMFVEGLMPFVKTPVNVLSEGIQYSPLGIANAFKKAVVEHKDINTVLNSASKGIVGTAWLVLGYMLSRAGYINAMFDDDEEKASKSTNAQSYSIKLPDGKGGFHYYTIDWLTSAALPMMTGAMLQQNEADNDEEFANNLLTALSNITDPVMEMSFMQSINSSLESLSNLSNGISAVPQLAMNTAQSYVSQYIPTIAGQIARGTDDVRRNYYSDKTGIAGSLEYSFNKTKGKIPVLSETLEPYIDPWGRTQENGSVAYNMLSPGYYRHETADEVNNGLRELYESTGKSGVFPSLDTSDKKFKIDGEERKLTPKEFTEFATQKGQASKELIGSLLNSKSYDKMNDEEKYKAVKDAYSLARSIAKDDMFGNSVELSAQDRKLVDMYATGGAKSVYSYNDAVSRITPTGEKTKTGRSETVGDLYEAFMGSNESTKKQLDNYLAYKTDGKIAETVATIRKQDGDESAKKYFEAMSKADGFSPNKQGKTNKDNDIAQYELKAYLQSADLSTSEKDMIWYYTASAKNWKSGDWR